MLGMKLPFVNITRNEITYWDWHAIFQWRNVINLEVILMRMSLTLNIQEFAQTTQMFKAEDCLDIRCSFFAIRGNF